MPGQVAVAVLRTWLTLPQAIADATGTATITAPEVGSGRFWEIDTIVISANSPVPGLCALYHGSPSQSSFITQAQNSLQDTYEGGLEVVSSEQLVIQWTLLVAGSICVARLHYTEYQTGSAPFDNTFIRMERH